MSKQGKGQQSQGQTCHGRAKALHAVTYSASASLVLLIQSLHTGKHAGRDLRSGKLP